MGIAAPATPSRLGYLPGLDGLRAVSTHPSWFASDGIHFTSAGYAGRATLLADALAATFPG